MRARKPAQSGNWRDDMSWEFPPSGMAVEIRRDKERQMMKPDCGDAKMRMVGIKKQRQDDVSQLPPAL
ncbi:MAG TPA: hypothetical protein DC009_05380 [Porphyromonadaceae bacterium]|nr:hypothetical protein [Porphyromonadaceae bacterium]